MLNYSDIGELSYIKSIELDLGEGTARQAVFAKRNDSESRYIEVTVTKDGVPFEVRDDALVVFRCLKPDGTSILSDGCAHGGKVYVELGDQTLAAEGRVDADITIYSGESVLSTQTFTLVIEPIPFDEDCIASCDDLAVLTQALKEVSGIMGKEEKANKVTVISETSTHDEYPSAKAAYDAIKALDDSIERITVDGEISETSANPVSSAAIAKALSKKADAADIPTVPDNVSAFANDAGYLSAETDPTVPDWAKQPEKPVYSAQEVGALPDTVKTLPSPGKLVFSGAVTGEYDGSEAVEIAVPSAPVASVNGKTGDVSLSAQDIGAMPADIELPTALPNPKVLRFTGALDAQYDGSEEIEVAIPSDYGVAVTSVNGKTGDISLTAADVGALADTTELPTALPNPHSLEIVTGAGSTIYDGSQNVKLALAEDGSGIVVDREMSASSENPVSNAAVSQALTEKQDKMTFTTVIDVSSGEEEYPSAKTVYRSMNDVTTDTAGTAVTVTDCADGICPREMKLYGRTMRLGMTSLTRSNALRSVGESGVIDVSVTGGSIPEQTVTVHIAKTGLSGVPVSSDGNYTDENGQQWVSDEIDLSRGVLIRRIDRGILNGEQTVLAVSSRSDTHIRAWISPVKPYTRITSSTIFADRIPTSSSDVSNGIFSGDDSKLGGTIVLTLEKAVVGITAEEITQWLSENPIEYVVAVTQVEEIPLSDEEIAQYDALVMRSPSTIISNGVGCHQYIAYAADTKKYVDKLSGGAKMIAAPVEDSRTHCMIERIKNMLIPTAAKRALPAAEGGLTQEGGMLTGVNYSSVYNIGNMVGLQVLLSTYYSAMENPASRLYQSEYDYSNDSNRSSYYGTVCSGFTAYVTGDFFYRTTKELADIWRDKVIDVETPLDLYKVRRGDFLLNTILDSSSGGHIKLVQDVLHDSVTGQLCGFNIAEAAVPYTKSTFFTPSEFMKQFSENRPYRVVRVANDDADMTVETVSYSRSIYPDKGDKAVYLPGEEVWLYVADASTKISCIINDSDLYAKDLSEMETKTVNGVNVYKFETGEEGYYRIFGDEYADACEITVATAGTLSFSGGAGVVTGASSGLEPVYAMTVWFREGEVADHSYHAPGGCTSDILRNSQKKVEWSRDEATGDISFKYPVPSTSANYKGYYVRLWLRDKNGSQIFADSAYIYN